MFETLEKEHWRSTSKWVAPLSGIGALLVVLLRIWVFPARRDMDTGLFSNNVIVIGVMALLLVVLGWLALRLRGIHRAEVDGSRAAPLALALLASGIVIAVTGGIDALQRLGVLDSVNSIVTNATMLTSTLRWLQTIFTLLSGIALVRLGWVLLAEGATRRGMAQWSALAPVAWMWLVLANYEMSYASMVRLTDGFFTLGMYIFEMVFLFCFARYVAGVGRERMGLLMFCAGGAALFALSAPLVRMLLYVLQESEAYTAMGAAGAADFMIGLLALVTCYVLAQSTPSFPSAEPAEEEEEVVWSELQVPSDTELIETWEEGDGEDNPA